jgi:hypothetical protein
MTLAASAANRAGFLKTFRSAVDREEESWRDHRYHELRDQHLAPLIAANERFDRELSVVAASVKAANRRLAESR